MEVDEDLVHRDPAGQHHAPRVEGLSVLDEPAFLGNESHDVAQVFARCDHERLHDGLQDRLDVSDVGHEGRIVYLLHRTIGHLDLIHHARVSRDDVHVELAAEALLHDLHVQQSEESTAQSEAEGSGTLGLEGQRRIVQLKLGDAHLEALVIGRVDRVNARKHHRMNLLEARQLRRRIARVGDGVAHLHLARGLDVGRDVAGLTHRQFIAGVRLGIEGADLLDLNRAARVQQLHHHTRLQGPVGHADQDHHAFVGVEVAVENQRLERLRLGRLRCRQTVDDRFQNVRNADALFGAGHDRVIGRNGQDFLQLLLGHWDIGVRQVDLVDDRNDRQTLLHGQVHIGDGLGLDTLSGIDDEQSSLTGAERTADLVGEVHMSWGVDQVQLVALPILGLVVHRDRMGLDGDATLLFQVHRIQMLCLERPILDSSRRLEQSVRQGGLPVVDVGDDAEIANVCGVHRGAEPIGCGRTF